VQQYLRQRCNLFVASQIHQCKPCASGAADNLGNAEKRKVAPLGQMRFMLKISTNRLRRWRKNTNSKTS